MIPGNYRYHNSENFLQNFGWSNCLIITRENSSIIHLRFDPEISEWLVYGLWASPWIHASSSTLSDWKTLIPTHIYCAKLSGASCPLHSNKSLPNAFVLLWFFIMKFSFDSFHNPHLLGRGSISILISVVFALPGWSMVVRSPDNP